MNTLREAAQAAPDAKVRAQHKEFARWFLELGDKSALASEYLAWLAWKAALAHPPRNEWREAAKEALRWMEHARLHLTIKERMHPDGLSLYDNAAEALRAALAEPEAEPEPVAWQVKKGDDMSTLREAAQAALEQWDKVSGVFRMTAETEALRAALAQPEATAADLRVYDAMAANYAHPPRDEWRPASVDCRTCRHLAKLGCMSTAMCVDGSQYKPTNPVQMWERTP